MKQYDKIWIPEKIEGFEFRDEDGDTPTLQKGSFIVLTVEELREVCKAMVLEWIEVHGTGSIDDDLEKDLTNYLHSKGIKL